MIGKSEKQKSQDSTTAAKRVVDEKREKKKRQQRREARIHFENFVHLMLKSTDCNSVEYRRLLHIMNYYVHLMDAKKKIHIKRFNKGNTRIYKKFNCCRGREEWKKCPEYRCPINP